MTTMKLRKADITEALGIEPTVFATNVSPLLNLASRFAHATRPAVVGQMSELILECPAQCVDDWEQWYLERHPEAMDRATARIVQKVQQFREALDSIDETVIRSWLRDLLVKTYQGLKAQNVILPKIAETLGKPLTPATPEDESKGIDGYIGKTPVSVKPSTLGLKPGLNDNLPQCIIFYTKTDAGDLEVTFDETLIT